jgi:hypothetical protein
MLLLLLAIVFRSPVRYPSAADQVVLVRDLDGDGAPEIIASGNQIDEQSAFSLFANRGDGTFAPERLVASNFGERLEDIGDLDGDGIPDLLVSNYWANGIATYHGRGSLQFDAEVAHGTATHGGPSRIAPPGIVSLSFGSGNPVRLHLFDGATKTTFETGLANGASMSSRTINGALELLVAEHSGHLGLIHIANGTVTVSRLDAGPFDLACTFADVNGDGVADIIDTNFDGAIFVTLAQRMQIATIPGALPSVIRAADLDRDGRVEIIVNDFQTSTLHVFRGDGFTEQIAIDAGGPVNDFAVADVNGDGLPDIVTANNDHSISVLINAGAAPRRRASKAP